MAAILKTKKLKNKKEELKKKDAQSEQTIIFDEDITCLEYKTNHGAPIFHAATHTSPKYIHVLVPVLVLYFVLCT